MIAYVEDAISISQILEDFRICLKKNLENPEKNFLIK